MDRVDRDALLVALVLAPATYSRNRFFQLYTDPVMRSVRHKASTLRSVVRHLARSTVADAHVSASAREGRFELTYVVPTIGLKRTTHLSRVELAVVRYAASRVIGPGSQLAATEDDRSIVEQALERLAAPSTEPDEQAIGR